MKDAELIRELLGRVEVLSHENGRLTVENERLANIADAKEVTSIRDMRNTVPELVAVCLSTPSNKIAQIKVMRDITGWSLIEAKEALERAWKRAGQNWFGSPNPESVLGKGAEEEIPF